MSPTDGGIVRDHVNRGYHSIRERKPSDDSAHGPHRKSRDRGFQRTCSRPAWQERLGIVRSNHSDCGRTPGSIHFELPDPGAPRLPIQPDAVLDACRDQVTAAGFRFTPIIGTHVPSDVIATTAHIGTMIFLGRNSDPTLSTPRRLGFTASMVLQNVQQTVVVCPLVYAPVERIVLLLAADIWDAELVASGATWAAALNVPALVAVGSDRSSSRNALELAQRALTDAGIPTSATIYSCRPEEFAEKLNPTSLVLIARRQRWGLLHLWFGSTTDRIVERASGPVAVMPKP